MSLDAATRARIEALIAADEVVLFMKGIRSSPQCGFSAQVSEILSNYRDTWTSVDVLGDETLREGIKRFSEWPTIPQLYVKGEFLGGADIIAQMHESGELSQSLGEPREAPAVPEIIVTEAAAEQIRAATADLPDDVLRLAIDYRFHNDLSIGPREDDDVVATSNGISLHFDPTSATRAHGVKLDFVTNDNGTGFKIDNPHAPPAVRDMSVEELRDRLAAGNARVYDVRTPGERNTARIEGTVLLDADARDELEGLDRATPLIFHCHHGGRSARAAMEYIGLGFREVYNVVGGIDAWSQRIDDSVARY